MFVVTVCWSGNIVAGKEALTGFSALALAQLRVLGAATIFAIIYLASGRRSRLQLSRTNWLFLVATAATGIALNQLAFISGIARTTVAHTGLIVATGPVIVLVIAVLLRLEVLTAWKVGGMLIAFGGVGILTADKSSQGAIGHWSGDLIMLLSVAVFAVYFVLMKEIAGQLDLLTLNTLTFLLGAGMMLPFCTRAVLATRWTGVTLRAWLGLAFLVMFGSVFSYLLFAYVMTHLSASRAAAFNYLQPIIASGLGVWILSERVTSKVILGGVLILGGVYLTERERGEEKTAESSLARAI
jgi:drug/metabolite transporter (DMT)-like permease